jgi:tetratricopeptide (TPR) repeat protein
MLQLINRPTTKIRVALLFLAALQISGCSSSAQRAQAYYEHGAKLLAAHDTQGAAIEFKNAVTLKKDLLPAWRGLAQIEELNHNLRGLIPILRTIVELDPKDVETKLRLAGLLLAGGATDAALKLVNSIDVADRPNASVLALKAAISFRLKDSSAAVSEAQAALKIDPSNIGATVVLAADRLANGDAKAALQILNSGPVASSKDLGVALLKIRIFEQLGDLAQVEAQLRKLTELYPQQVEFRKQLIKFYIDQHRPGDAENELRTIAAADPKNSDAALDVVRFLIAENRAPAARSELVAHINAGGNVFPYQMALAGFDYAQGNFDDSFKLLQTLASDASSPEHALAAKTRLAEMNLERKNIDAAAALVADILRSDNRNTSALKLRATIEMDRDQLEPAISDLRAALNDQPRSTDLMLLLATAYERSGSIELAEKQFADATKVSNYDAGVALNFAAFLRRRGSIQRADDVLTDLASRQPNNVAVLSALAEIKLERQDWAGAEAISESIRRIGNSNAIADQIAGTALSGEQKYNQSIAAFQSAEAAAPSAVQPMASLVGTLLRAKQTDKAMSFLQDVLKTNPTNAEALVLLGSVQLAKNAPDQAMTSFKTAIAKQPKDAVGYRALADLYLSQKNDDAALKVIQAGLKEQPDNITLHITLAGLQDRNKDYDAAIAEYEYVLTQQPGSMIAANNLASLLSDHRTDQASLNRAQSLTEMLRKTPVPQFKDTVGWVSYRQGDFKSAVKLLEEAAAALPGLALVHYHLGMGYEATGQDAKAAEEFKTALTKSPTSDLTETIKGELKKTAIQ